MSDHARKVVRDRLVVTMYMVNAVGAFFLYCMGPATALIARDLGLSATVAALHGTAVAVAMVSTGFVTPGVIARLGRTHALVAMQVVFVVGVLLIATAPSLPISLAGALVGGLGSQSCSVIANATLAEARPDAASALLTESNAMGAWAGLLAPLFMGIALALGIGWRWGLAVAVPMCLATALAARGLTLARPREHPRPVDVEAAVVAGNVALGEHIVGHAGAGVEAASLDHPDPTRSRLAVAFWIVLAAVFASAGIEFAVNFWGATLMSQEFGADDAVVTTMMGAPLVGLAIGRTVGSRLTTRVDGHALLIGGFAVSIVGFVAFWSAGGLAQAGAGLFVFGLGISVLYPLLLDRAVVLMPDATDRALALCVAAAGSAIGAAPFALGALSGRVSVQEAFLIVPALAVGGLLAVAASRPSHSAEAHAQAHPHRRH